MGIFSRKKKDDDGRLEEYAVVYLGGRPENPKKLSGKIELILYSDHLKLSPTFGSKGKWDLYEIPYNTISKWEYTKREVGGMEALLSGGDTRDIQTNNNIQITHDTDSGELILRLEMLTGVHVAVQAQKCQELDDKMRVHGIRDQFIKAPDEVSVAAPAIDIPEQIEKIASLLEKGLITQEEYDQKKQDLLAKL